MTNQKKSNNEHSSTVPEEYSLDNPCPLTESQLNIYLDIISNSKTDSYLIPVRIPIPREYEVEKLLDALEKLIAAHPILEMKLSEEFDTPHLVKGRKPSITIESDAADAYGRDFVTRPFDLQDSLSRFLILENDEIYNLFAVFHHLIFDGLSASVLEHNLFEILKGKTIDVDDSFLRVSAFDSQISEKDEFDEASLFFESMLADIDEAGVLLGSIEADGPGNYNIDLELDISEFLDKYETHEYVLFASVFAYTLSRFVGDNKVSFNIVENGRDRFNNFNSIGMFVNTLPLLVECKDQEIISFIDYMSDIIYGVMEYNYYPFRLLASEYDITSDILFQFKPDLFTKGDVTFVENSFDRNVRGGIIRDMNDFITDLEVDVVQKGEEYSLNIMYSDKYSRKFIEHIGESFKLILHGFVNEDKLSDINYTSESDLEILDSYNETECQLEYEDILDAFNDNLSKYPGNYLVSFNDVRYTYSQGAFIADKISKNLSDLGISPQDNVAFLTERCDYYMFSILGILSAGAVYVPLDEKHPDERLKFILEDTAAKVIIASDETYERVKELSDASILNISEIGKEDIKTLDALPVAYGDLACILYTSGTTGIPKGVKVTRKSVVNVAKSYIDTYNLDSTDVYALFSGIGFDVSSFVITVVMYAGACLSVVPEDIRLNMLELNNYFMAQKVSHAFITTQVGKLFMQSVNETSLEVLLVAGEKLGEFESPKGYQLVDAYGPTEAFAFVTSIKNCDKLDYSSVGFCNSNVKFYVLDDDLRRVPIGASGELYLAGYQVAEGYLNRDEETDKAFIDNPFDDGDYGKLYRTGDIVRVLPDGSLGIVGRSDSQVKIRGNRVELSEIEAVIREIEEIKDVTVQTVKHGSNSELIAYVVGNEEENVLNDLISTYIGDCKPEYMIPSYVIKMDEIPLNVNAKVDKRALPKVNLSNLGGEYVAPENDVEAFFVECFEEVLGLSKVSTTDNFFEMGGDSLIVIKIIYKALSEGYAINYADLFDNPTPKSLAKIILSNHHNSDDAKNDDYDYSLINNLLAKNSIELFDVGKCDYELGDVLLTGVTGFLGIHILKELLESEKGNVYCLIRSKKDSTIEERLDELLGYYFDEDFAEFKDRLHLVEGDITNPRDLKKLSSHNIDTVINSAANVKYFAYGSEIKDINLDGAINCLEFAKAKNARFIQVSTISVAGIRIEEVSKDVLHENELFIGQDFISNKYVESKFLAERAILESRVRDNADVKIMRVGNLMARSYDGKFQINYETNAFIKLLKSYVTMGSIYESISQEELEFSPVDLTAKSILMLSKTPKDCTVFHPASDKLVRFRELVDVFNKLDLNVEIVDDEKFQESLSEILKDESQQEAMFGIASVISEYDGLGEEYLWADKEYTLNVLSELGFKWPETSEEYLSGFIKFLKDFDYFKIQ